ncbi:hypothetical protein VE02_10265 [Pseudogymnoascus sp. 03VT05]|nr:hypothetical protein VE02_10265 [Pseudogymnoascus sp. 03VT05]
MERYVDYLASQTKNSTLAYGLGDWIAFDTSTPLGITATFGYYEALKGMQTIAAALEKTADSTKYASMISELLASFQDEFAMVGDGTYTYGSGSQASDAIALDIGVVPPKFQAQVAQNIVDSILKNGNHLTVGEIALPSLFRVLQSGGHNDVLYQMMTVPTSPSYAYQVLNGATSLTERWDGPTANRPGSNSLNHFMVGYADQWLSELSGLSQTKNSVAWESINFSPILVTNMTSADSSYRTARGLASAGWTRANGVFSYNVIVPVGATGLVTFDLETLDVDHIKENGVVLTPNTQGNGIVRVENGNGVMVVQIGSGQYDFISSRRKR